MQEILVNVDKQRNKTIVVVENGRLVEKYQENDGAERLEGNIYIGKVQNVLLGMHILQIKNALVITMITPTI